MTIREAAKIYHEEGYKLVVTDSKKVPFVSWTSFREKQTWEDIEKMLSNPKAHSIAIIPTGGIECIDIDSKYDLTGTLFEDYMTSVIAKLGDCDALNNILIQSTKNNGYHVVYRSTNTEGNQKLAIRETTPEEQNGNPNDTSRVLLETRGDGGYFLVYPSEGYQILERPNNGKLIAGISEKDRDSFINVAKTFDECDTHHRSIKAQKSIPQNIKGSSKSTIQAFNETNNCFEMLQNEGWEFSHQRGDNYYLVRPNKSIKDGHGASYNEKLQKVYIFTSSTQLEQNTAYDAFALYAALQCSNDFKQAARQLYRQGYGDRLSKTMDSFSTQTVAITSGNEDLAEKVVSGDAMLKMFKDSRIYIENAIEMPEWVLSVYQENMYTRESELIGLACYGDVVLLTGLQKSRKTGVSSAICASALGYGNNVLNFYCQNKERKIAYIDTEQADYQASSLIHKIYEYAEVEKKTTDRFYYQRVKKYTKQEKQRFLRWLAENVKDIGVLILDGIVDLCEDYNDNKVSSALITYIERLADEFNILILIVLHDARSTGNARGHLGTEALNKTSCHIKVKKADEAEGGNYSTVSFPNVRDKQPQSFEITHNEQGRIVLN